MQSGWDSYPLRNRVVNAGFDRDLSGWNKTDAMNAVKYTVTASPIGTGNKETRTGWSSAQLGGGVDGLEQTITGLQPNTTYIASGWARVPSGETAVLGIKDYGGGDTSVPFAVSSPNWSNKTITFTTGSSNTSVTMYMKKTSSGSGVLYVDDAGLIDAKNRIDQSSPEADGYYWNDDQDFAVMYSPDWNEVADHNSYMGTERVSNVANAFAEYTFLGNSVEWIASKGHDYGEADVYVDGVLDTSGIDLYRVIYSSVDS